MQADGCQALGKKDACQAGTVLEGGCACADQRIRQHQGCQFRAFGKRILTDAGASTSLFKGKLGYTHLIEHIVGNGCHRCTDDDAQTMIPGPRVNKYGLMFFNRIQRNGADINFSEGATVSEGQLTQPLQVQGQLDTRQSHTSRKSGIAYLGYSLRQI